MVPAGILILLGLLAIAAFVVWMVQKDRDQQRQIDEQEHFQGQVLDLMSRLYAATPPVQADAREAFERFFGMTSRTRRL